MAIHFFTFAHCLIYRLAFDNIVTRKAKILFVTATFLRYDIKSRSSEYSCISLGAAPKLI